MSHRIQFEQWVAMPVEKVFLFFANPNNLPRIKLAAPPMRPGIANRDGLAGVSSEIVTSFRLFPFLPLRAQWIALITEFEWNHHFADIQKKGPFKRFRHRHEMSAEMRDGVTGTVVRDNIEYDAGFGVLGDVANKLFIAPSLRKTFEYRQKMLEKLLG